jgi:hypothetical protein
MLKTSREKDVDVFVRNINVCNGCSWRRINLNISPFKQYKLLISVRTVNILIDISNEDLTVNVVRYNSNMLQ